MGLGQLPHYLTKKITPETYSKIQKLEGEPAELSAIKETINVLIDVIEDLSGGNGRNLFASRIGLGVFPPTCTIDAIDDTQSELAKFTSGGGFDFGFTSYYSNNSMRSRFGFAGGAGNIFTNGIANGTFVQANNGPLMLGVDTSLAMIIREVGYGPGTGYVGFGGVNDPLSTVEIGGENAPRLGLNPQASAVGRKHWEIVSLANDYGSENGNLQFYNRTDGI